MTIGNAYFMLNLTNYYYDVKAALWRTRKWIFLLFLQRTIPVTLTTVTGIVGEGRKMMTLL